MSRRAFFIELQDMSTLLTVLTQVSCLGSQLTRIVAGENVARFEVLVSDRVARHFANRLGNIVGVIDLIEIDSDAIFDKQAFVGLNITHCNQSPSHASCCMDHCSIYPHPSNRSER